MAASQTLRAALCKAEAAHPGLSYDLVLGLVKKSEVSVNMNESLLRLQGMIAEQDSKLLELAIQPIVAIYLKFLFRW
jgi:programmed cell death protein 10